MELIHQSDHLLLGNPIAGHHKSDQRVSEQAGILCQEVVRIVTDCAMPSSGTGVR